MLGINFRDLLGEAGADQGINIPGIPKCLHYGGRDQYFVICFPYKLDKKSDCVVNSGFWCFRVRDLKTLARDRGNSKNPGLGI